MRVVISIDSFKGSLSSAQAAQSIATGVRSALPDAQIAICLLADGGEGTVDALASALDAKRIGVRVHGPLLQEITAEYALTADGRAIMEMSAAAGITLLSAKERDPRRATTLGVGEMIGDAIDRGARHIIIGIGGSATNDGGIGMLSALGFVFLDENGEKIPPYGAEGAGRVAKILAESVRPEVWECRFSIACDVKNPLCGEQGCSAVYGPQKGADDKAVAEMDDALSRFAKAALAYNPKANPDAQGAGAAGGLGFAFLTFLNGELLPGAELVITECGLEPLVKQADVVVTGEGKIDFQSAMGKAPSAVAALAKRYGKPVIAFCGAIDKEGKHVACPDIDAIFPIPTAPCSLAEAMEVDTAARNLTVTAEQVFRTLTLMK